MPATDAPEKTEPLRTLTVVPAISAVHVAKMNEPSCLEKMLATNVASYGLEAYVSVGEQTTHHVFGSALESATLSRLAPSIPGASKVWPTVASPLHSRRWDTESRQPQAK